MDELQGVFKWKVRKLASRVLSSPQRPSLDRSAEADVGVRLRGQERMFSRHRATIASRSLACDDPAEEANECRRIE
jgi:hypothetical protein